MDFHIDQVSQTYPTRDERHPYNIWGFKKKKKREKFKKKKTTKKNKRIDIYA